MLYFDISKNVWATLDVLCAFAAFNVPEFECVLVIDENEFIFIWNIDNASNEFASEGDIEKTFEINAINRQTTGTLDLQSKRLKTVEVVGRTVRNGQPFALKEEKMF
jgi:hypothetical protein